MATPPPSSSGAYNGKGGRVEALDVAISLFRDLNVAANLIDRSSYSPAWLAHVMIDAIRSEPPPAQGTEIPLLNDVPSSSSRTKAPGSHEDRKDDSEDKIVRLMMKMHARKSDGNMLTDGEPEEEDDAKANGWIRHPFNNESKLMVRVAGSKPVLNGMEGLLSASISLATPHDDALANLITTMLRAGSNLELDVALYLRSLLLMGGGPMSSMSVPNMRGLRRQAPGTRQPAASNGIAISDSTLLSWILNEAQRQETAQRNAAIGALPEGEVVLGTGSTDFPRPRKDGGGSVSCGLASLILSAGGGHAGACRALLDSKRVDVSGLDDLAICVACHGGWITVVKTLLEFGANPHARDGMPCRVAKLGERTEIVELLMNSPSQLHV
ncbi:hypothetical protein HDU97_001329 [Phlyctochytrium planicorne]|nr:hypothetical protein HDU97_001329 [Phlyctochytrium planicorne]